jgi:hypothetical protein
MSVTRDNRSTRTAAGSRAPATRRRRVRLIAAALAAATSLLYFMIGLQVVHVLDDTSEQTGFGLIAGAAFLAGALVLLLIDHRALWVAGAVAQVLIIFMYVNLGAEREPSFEFWGIALRVLQVGLLAALIYLAVRPRTRAAHAG